MRVGYLSYVNQVPLESLVREKKSVEDMACNPCGFVSGSFKRSQLKWTTFDMERFAIVDTFKRLYYILRRVYHVGQGRRLLRSLVSCVHLKHNGVL